MVYDILNRILDIPYNLFSNFLDIPSIGPFFYLEYSGIIILGLFLLTILLSKFLKFKNIIYLIILTSILGLVFKDIYLAFTTIILLTILFFLIRLIKFKKIFSFLKSRIIKGKSDEDDFSMDDEDNPSEEKSTEYGESKIGSSQNSNVDRIDENSNKDQKMMGVKGQKMCPYCNNSLSYIPQYGRYYCYYCKKYI